MSRSRLNDKKLNKKTKTHVRKDRIRNGLVQICCEFVLPGDCEETEVLLPREQESVSRKQFWRNRME